MVKIIKNIKDSRRVWIVENLRGFMDVRTSQVKEMTNQNRIRTTTRIYICLVISRSFCMIFVI